VNGMLPENNAINQQLPLTLSWIPANPSLNYTFDIYVWRSDSTQPGTPFVNGISTVNYTLSINSGLQYNQTYKWMVVAHNGSCTQINTGPIQQFSLIPLPDLQPINVQAPVSAFSGQTVAINWTVKNNGPGSTGSKSWTDAVFLSFDTSPNFSIPPETNPGGWSSLQFPIRTLLIGT
ncbi:MAG TPA: CARDB domain-containing protein, partial [Chitinophagaceae bacterium]|nr:CARDB domain-containing protein [Chitinophagaceae bacterium]